MDRQSWKPWPFEKEDEKVVKQMLLSQNYFLFLHILRITDHDRAGILAEIFKDQNIHRKQYLDFSISCITSHLLSV